jgi:hypothetical protein
MMIASTAVFTDAWLLLDNLETNEFIPKKVSNRLQTSLQSLTTGAGGISGEWRVEADD